MVAPPTHGFALPDTRSAELFRDRWVCLVDARNPALDAGRLRLEDLARLPWVAPYYSRTPAKPGTPASCGRNRTGSGAASTTLALQPSCRPRLNWYLG